MNAKDFYIVIGNIDDDLIVAAGETPARRKKPIFVYTAVASAACLCLIIGGIAFGLSGRNEQPPVSDENISLQKKVTEEAAIITTAANAEEIHEHTIISDESPTLKRTEETTENIFPAEYSNSVFTISVYPDTTEEEISALLQNEQLSVVFTYTEQRFAVAVPAPLNETEEAEFVDKLKKYSIVAEVEPDQILSLALGLS